MLTCITALFGLNQLYNWFKLNIYCTVHYLYWQVYLPPWPTNVLSRILLPSRALLHNRTGWTCSWWVYKEEEPQTLPPVFYLQPYWKLELEEPNLNRIWGTQCCENNKMMPRLPRSTSSDRRKGSRHLEQLNFSGTWVEPTPSIRPLAFAYILNCADWRLKNTRGWQQRTC